MEEREETRLTLELSRADLIDLTQRGMLATARLIEILKKHELTVEEELTLRHLRYTTAYAILTRKEPTDDPPDEAA